MKPTFAWECFADTDVARCLLIECGLDFHIDPADSHAHCQGNVVNHLFHEGKASFGMVDEDPKRSHHSTRDILTFVYRGAYLDWGVFEDKYLIVLKPELERCFLESMKTVELCSAMAKDPKTINEALGKRDHPWHKIFSDELALLYRKSQDTKTVTFITELEDAVREILRRLAAEVPKGESGKETNG